jgi:hypothetical protein
MLRQAKGGGEMNRRDVVQGILVAAATGGAMLGASPPGRAALPGRTAGRDLNLVVFDSRFGPARQFAERLANDGWIARGISGDVTALWHELLDRRWPENSVAMYGMTTPRSFNCIEQLVADRFWRVTSQVPAGPLVEWALQPLRITP